MSNVLKTNRILDSGNTQSSSGGDSYWEIQNLEGDVLVNIDQTFDAGFFVLKQNEESTAYIAVIPDTDMILFRVSSGENNVDVALQVDGTLKINFTNTIATSQFPEYADDAAADADLLLIPGSFYKVTGDRSIRQKP